MLPVRWWNRYERIGEPVPIDYADEQAFRRWCATTPAPPGGGRINLLGLRPLVAAEISGDCSSTPAAPGRNAGSSGGSVRW